MLRYSTVECLSNGCILHFDSLVFCVIVVAVNRSKNETNVQSVVDGDNTCNALMVSFYFGYSVLTIAMMCTQWDNMHIFIVYILSLSKATAITTITYIIIILSFFQCHSNSVLFFLSNLVNVAITNETNRKITKCYWCLYFAYKSAQYICILATTIQPKKWKGHRKVSITRCQLIMRINDLSYAMTDDLIYSIVAGHMKVKRQHKKKTAKYG